jgi:transcription elongation factor GreB
MPRYRPPAPKSSLYITQAGYHALGSELEDLWERRREVLVHLTVAAHEGDRSENAEYICRKKQLRELDRRIGYLQRRLPLLKVVTGRPAAAGTRVLRGLGDPV